MPHLLGTPGYTMPCTMPVSSSGVMKTTPLAVGGRWRIITRRATRTRSFSIATTHLRS